MIEEMFSLHYLMLLKINGKFLLQGVCLILCLNLCEAKLAIAASAFLFQYPGRLC